MRIREITESIQIDESFYPNKKQLVKALLRKGFVPKQGGNHTKYVSLDGQLSIPVSHGPIISYPVTKAIMKQAGLSPADF